MKNVTQLLYKYGTLRETTQHPFENNDDAIEFINDHWPERDYEPQPEDFEDLYRYKYYLAKFQSEKTATKDDSKWFAEFYIDGVLISKGVLDL